MNCFLNATGRIRAIAIVGIALFFYSATGCSQQDSPTLENSLAQSDTPHPNIILVIVDDAGLGDLGINNPIVQTPYLDEFAKNTINFTNFHVDPTCSMTRAALMTGQHSLKAGVWHTVMGRHLLADQHVTLPEVLKQIGYNTAIFGKWHLGDNYPFRPQDQGFDHVLIHGGGGVGQSPDYWGNTQFDDVYLLNGDAKKYSGYATDVWFDEAISFMTQSSTTDDPFFMYLATNAPHVPYRAPDDEVAAYKARGLPDDMALFYAMMTNIDSNMGRLIQAVSDQGLSTNTVIIFMGDNGSSLAMHADGEPYNWLNDATISQFEFTKKSLNNDMRGGKVSVYDGGHRVPFFLSIPDYDGAKTVDTLTAHIDVMPTLLDLIRHPKELSHQPFDGTSLMPLITDSEPFVDRAIVVTNQRILQPNKSRPFAVMDGDWRYVKATDGPEVELFDVGSDPRQQNNLIKSFPDRAKAMSAIYDSWWENIANQGFPTHRIGVGSAHENPSRLSAHDWLADSTDQVAWWPGFNFNGDKWSQGWLGNEHTFAVADWAVTFETSGVYRFDLYFHDKPAGAAIPGNTAFLALNDHTVTDQVALGATFHSFEVNVTAGDTDIKAWFENSPSAALPSAQVPAFFLYVEKLDDL